MGKRRARTKRTLVDLSTISPPLPSHPRGGVVQQESAPRRRAEAETWARGKCLSSPKSQAGEKNQPCRTRAKRGCVKTSHQDLDWVAVRNGRGRVDGNSNGCAARKRKVCGEGNGDPAMTKKNMGRSTRQRKSLDWDAVRRADGKDAVKGPRTVRICDGKTRMLQLNNMRSIDSQKKRDLKWERRTHGRKDFDGKRELDWGALRTEGSASMSGQDGNGRGRCMKRTLDSTGVSSATRDEPARKRVSGGEQKITEKVKEV